MANMYIGINEQPKKILKMYIGVNGVAKRVRRIFSGINNDTAKLLYGTSILSKTNNAPNLSGETCGSCGCKVGEYALFAGSARDYRNTVEAYDKNLTKTFPTPLLEQNAYSSACNINDYVLIAGGVDNRSNKFSSVDVYNSELVKTYVELSVKRSHIGAANTKDYAIFVGGNYESSSIIVQNAVDIFDSSFTRIESELPYARYEYASGGSTKNHAVFFNGDGSLNSPTYSGTIYIGSLDNVIAYDNSLTLKYPQKSGYNGCKYANANVGRYTLFAGGSGGINNKVFCYDDMLTLTTVELQEKRGLMAATNVGNHALFAGGSTNGSVSSVTSYVDEYDENLTHTIAPNLSDNKHNFSGSSVGKYALFAGGIIPGPAAINVVETYKIS